MPPPAVVTSASIGDAVIAMVEAIKAQGGKEVAAAAQLTANTAKLTAEGAQTVTAAGTAKAALDVALADIIANAQTATQVTAAADAALKVQLDLITNKLNGAA